MKHIKTFESFINEVSSTESPRVKGFLNRLFNTEHQSIKDMEAEDEEPSDALYNAMKQLGCKAEECYVIGDMMTGDWNRVLDSAKKAGIKYVKVEDDNGSYIVFAANESRAYESETNFCGG